MYSSFLGTVLLEQETSPPPGVTDEAAFDCTGEITLSSQAPEWRRVANLRFAHDWCTVNLRWRYFGAVD